MAGCEEKVLASCEGEITVRVCKHDSSCTLCRRSVAETDGLSNVFQCFSHDATVKDATFSAVLNVSVHKSHQCGPNNAVHPFIL